MNHSFLLQKRCCFVSFQIGNSSSGDRGSLNGKSSGDNKCKKQTTQKDQDPISSNSSGDTKHTYKNSKAFTKTIYKAEIKRSEIFTIVTTKSTKQRTQLKSGWTSLLCSFIWQKWKLPCAWAFNRGSYRIKNVKCVGKCTQPECDATIKCYATENQLILHIKKSTEDVRHKKKRRILSVDKPKYVDALRNQKAHVVRSRLADNLMDPGDPESPIILGGNAARKIRSGISAPKMDPIQHLLKLSERNIDCIQNIGLTPFVLFFSTPLQRAFYRAECKRQKVTISIDATGLKIRPPVKSSKYSCLYLYIICVHGLEKAYPVAQMISEIHTMDWIQYWLSTWWRENQSPREIVTDESSALIGAAVRTFTDYKSTNAYIDACMGALFKSEKLKCTYIRIDRSHFVKSIMRNVRCESKITGKLIRGVMGYLISCDDFKKAEHIIESLFTLIRHEYLTPDCQKAKNYLSNLINTHDFEFMDHEKTEGNIANEQIEAKETVKTYKDTQCYKWIAQLYESAKPQKNRGGYEASVYFAPKKLKKYLLHSLARIPLWSNLMNATFDSNKVCATSSASENEFKNIKRLLGINSVRTDVFVSKFIDFLNGHLKLGLGSQLTNMAKTEANREKITDDDSDSSKAPTPKGRISQNRVKRLTKKRSSTFNDKLDLRYFNNDIKDAIGSKQRNHKNRVDEIKVNGSSEENKSSRIITRSKIRKRTSTEKKYCVSTETESCSGSKNDKRNATRSRKRKHVSDSDSLEEKKQPSENWRGKNKKSPAPKTARDRRAVNSILTPHDVEYRHWRIPQLRNGFFGEKIVISNTCAFDAITSVFAVFYADYKQFKISFQSSSETSPFLKFITNMFANNSNNLSKEYQERNDILFSVYSIDFYKGAVTKLQDGTYNINCDTGIAPFFDKLTHCGNNDLATVRQNERCFQCNYNNDFLRPYISTLGNYDYTPALKYLLSSRLRVCPKCHEKSLNVERSFNDKILTFEVEAADCSEETKTTIEALQEIVTIRDKRYKLQAVIEFLNNPKHFVAYVLRKSSWECYNDMNFKQSAKYIEQTNIQMSLLFYVNEELD